VLDELTPAKIVRELDKYVIGRPTRRKPSPSRCATASAARSSNRKWPKRYAEKHPHDRPTGVGKTELPARLAKLANSPFLKVEATSLPKSATSPRCRVDDPRSVEISIDMVREERLNEVGERAERTPKSVCWNC